MPLDVARCVLEFNVKYQAVFCHRRKLYILYLLCFNSCIGEIPIRLQSHDVKIILYKKSKHYVDVNVDLLLGFVIHRLLN